MMDYKPLGNFIVEYSQRNDNSYRPVAVGRYGIRTRESIYSKELAKDYSKNKVIFKNTLTVGMGSVQIDIGVLTDDMFYSVSPAYHTYKIEGIDAEYLKYCLECRNQDMFMRYVKRGSRQGKTIDLKRWLLYEIPVYSPDEQRGIVRNLDFLQNIIEKRLMQLEKYDDFVKSQFIEMFGSVNKAKYPVMRIGAVAKLQGGYAFKSTDYMSNGVPIVQIANVNRDNLDWNEMNCVPAVFLEKYSEFALNPGDLVMAMTRPVIKSLNAVKLAVVSEQDVPCLLNQRVGRFRIERTKINRTYLMSCCQMQDFKDYVVAMSGNSLQPNISSKQVENYSIVLPPIELQNKFAAFVKQTDKSKVLMERCIFLVNTLRKVEKTKGICYNIASKEVV